MSSIDELVEKLRWFGWSRSEAKVYAALVKMGAATVTEVTRETGIPMSRMYDIVSKLERLGYVEVRNGRPKLIKAIPPAKLVDKVRERVERDLEEIAESLKPAKAAEPEETLWTIRGLRNTLRKVRELLSDIKAELLVAYLPPTCPRAVINHLEQFKQIAGRYKIIRLIVNSKNPHLKVIYNLLKDAKNIEVRFIGVDGPLQVIGDRSIVLICMRLSDEPKDEDFLTVVIRNKWLAEFMAREYQLLWEESKAPAEGSEGSPPGFSKQEAHYGDHYLQ